MWPPVSPLAPSRIDQEAKMADPADVQYIDATCVYPQASAPALDHLALDIAEGEFMVLVGPSGSGKSTALRMLAGLERTTSGEIRIGGENIARRHPKDRDIAMVFQSYALYPHMSVADNMGFALRLAGIPKRERAERVREAARLLDLERYLERKPKALSGGQRQRVAMGRAIVREPRVFLMDEPLSNLDAKLRVETRANIAALQQRLRVTTVYVTHDQVEAMTMGDRVAVLRDGVLQQVDTPGNLYRQPANAFVAGFIGSPAMNLRRVPVSDRGAEVGGVPVSLPQATLAAVRAHSLREVTLGVRPENLTVSDAPDALRAQVRLVEELGADSYIYATIPGDDSSAKYLVVRSNGGSIPRVGDSIGVSVPQDGTHVFHPETGERLNAA
jgi:multiple sugar transport system ATP-binding protein